MTSMYVTIMNLPLFKGLGSEQVSSFLEKTHIVFENYRAGDTVYTEGEVCKTIRFVIRGEVKLSQCRISKRCKLSQVLGQGSALGMERLFGLTPCYADTATAVGNLSLMTLTKEQFLTLLQTDRIYIFNTLNYLSLRAQRSSDMLPLLYRKDLAANLAYWVATMTDRNALSIEIESTPAALASITGKDREKTERQLAKLERQGIIERKGKIISILNRAELIEMNEDS